MVLVFMSSYCRTQEEARLRNNFTPRRFCWEEIPNRVPVKFRPFAVGEVATFVRRGCLVPFEEVRAIDSSVRWSVIMAECRAVKAASCLRNASA